MAKRVRMKSVEKRGQELVAFAQRLKDAGLNWVQAQNAIYGPGGPYRDLFPSRTDRTEFTKTGEHRQLQKLLADLPQPEAKQLRSPKETSGQILVRVPKSLHAALLDEARNEGTSLNQLIVSKLSLQLRAGV